MWPCSGKDKKCGPYKQINSPAMSHLEQICSPSRIIGQSTKNARLLQMRRFMVGGFVELTGVLSALSGNGAGRNSGGISDSQTVTAMHKSGSTETNQSLSVFAKN